MVKHYNKWSALFGGWFGLHRYMAGEIGMGIVYTCTSGLFGIGWIVDTIKAFSDSQTKSENPDSQFTKLGVVPEKTFSFQAAGFRFKCRFPNTRFDERQFILVRSHVGDSVSLRQYEWEGKPAIALISDKYGADLGVVPASHVNTILKLTEKYDVIGKIIDLERIEYRKEFYTKCDIELSCFDKQSSANIDKIEE